MAHRSNHLHWRPSNGLNRTHIRAHISHKDLCQEPPPIQYHTLSVNCLAQRIQPIQRVNILFLGVSTATPSTQKRNHSFQAMVVFPFPSRCPITALLIMGLLITGLHIFNIMPSLRHNNSTTTEWDTTWLDKVQTTRCHLIMHLLIWLIGR
jgi:hypothetical protein